jgi:hypothetical protein
MSTRRLWLVLALLLMPAGAGASDHVFDTYVAGSYLAGNGSRIRLKGLHVSGAVTAGERHRSWSFVGDVSVHFGEEKEGAVDADLTQLTFMAGPRRTFRGGHAYMPFLQATALGAVHRTGGLQDRSTTGMATAVAVGLDVAPGNEGTWGTRVQVELVAAHGLRPALRVSAGLLFRHHVAHRTASSRRPR